MPSSEGTRIRGIDDIRALAASDYRALVPDATLAVLLARNSATHGDRPAITALDAEAREVRRWTHAELHREVLRVAALMAASFRPGSNRTAVLICRNEPLVPALIWGIGLAGVSSALNYLLSVDTLAALIRAEAAEIVVIPGPGIDAELWDKGRRVVAGLDFVRRVFVLGDLPGDLTDPRFVALGPALDAVPANSIPDLPAPDPSRVLAIYHTGGTTGVPKLVPLTEANLIHSAWGFAGLFDLSETDVVVDGLPTYHVGGTMSASMSVLYRGGHVVLAGPDGFRSPAMLRSYWSLVERYRVTMGGGVPTTIGALAAVPVGDADISSLRFSFTGGATISAAVADRYEAVTGKPLLEQYGMTETFALIAAMPLHGPKLRGSVGLHTPFGEVRVVGPDGITRLGATEVGRVQVRGPNVFRGYVTPEHNDGLFSPDGWMNTGDLGLLTDLGQLVLSGRAKDIIIRSAHNIDPRAIEEVADSHPDIALSAAVGMPDAYAGELPVVFVQPRPGASCDAGALRAWIAERVPEPPARPKAVFVIDRIPTTGVGKIFKPTLREMALAGKVRLMLADLGADAAGWEIAGDLQSGRERLVSVSFPAGTGDLRARLAKALAEMDIRLV